MFALWNRISSLGVENQPIGERRRIRLTNQGAVIGIVSCLGFIVGYLIAGPRFFVPMLANVVVSAFLVIALVLNGRKHHTQARCALLLSVNLGVLFASAMLGRQVGYHYYFFLFGMVSFLLFEEQRTLKWTFASLSAVCCVAVVSVASDEGYFDIMPQLARGLSAGSAIAVTGTVMLIVHLFTRETTLAEASLAKEHARSEKLLLNILPLAISTRLKAHGDPIADGFANVTVLFADLVGFTELSQRLSPQNLVRMLNHIFSAFDDLAEGFGIEKIKTIGDCYMVAAGLPAPRGDHVEAMARMALRMRDTLERINTEHGYALRIRIGLHTGPVVAGVIGKSKFIYDLWGDTVNTASRMESSGTEQHIHITKAVHEHLESSFVTEARGAITVKGKGEMETYWLLREKA